MSRVFYARRIKWQSEDGSWNEQYGVPAIVRCTGQNRSDRRRFEHTAKVCGVALIPIQWGETMAHGHTAVVAWLALCDGDNASLEAMERFLECGMVQWEHCTMLEVPYGKTTTRPKRKAQKPWVGATYPQRNKDELKKYQDAALRKLEYGR